MQGKIKKKGLLRVSVYLTMPEAQACAVQAEALKFRRVGLPIQKQKEHGFNGEWEANTDGISRYLKLAHAYYVEHEAERLKAQAGLAERKRQLAEEEARLSASALLARTLKQPAEGGGSG